MKASILMIWMHLTYWILTSKILLKLMNPGTTAVISCRMLLIAL
uniref:Uncharacterized protein n=1 Tax=Wuchereria bancrofti TaxID=6293 RepID=A0A1I8EU80_WUCBA